MSKTKKEWWYPKLIDSDYVKKLREDYPDGTQGLDDEMALEKFDNSQKYSTLWDHVGEAYEQFEPLADAYLELEGKVDDALNVLDWSVGVSQDVLIKLLIYVSMILKGQINSMDLRKEGFDLDALKLERDKSKGGS